MDFIYINEKSISVEFCNKIIDTFEKEPNKYKGITNTGLNIKIKDTLDFHIDIHANNETPWYDINQLLYTELSKTLKDFNTFITNKYNVNFFNNQLCDTGFLIQKYNKKEGKFLYHEDFSILDNIHRVITYIWYLNDVDEGGETEFCGDFKIKPRAGKLVLFPASWCYPHSGFMPISDNKYIITGWLYTT
jgi:hypothetical protein